MGKNGFQTGKVLICITLPLILAILLILSAMIPRELIEAHCVESAEYLKELNIYRNFLTDVECSKADRYADSVLLNISYHYDSKDPIRTVMLSSFYHEIGYHENVGLYHSVTEGREANLQYLRYWHGSITLIRPLLVFLNYKQILILQYIVLSVMLLGLLVFLWKRNQKKLVVAIGAGLIATSVWFVPTSIEYVWMYYLMAIYIFIVTKMAEKNMLQLAGAVFFCFGIVTNYLDFLTAETITLTVPLLVLIWLADIPEKKERWKISVKACFAWLTGYAGMWVLKWVMASVILKVDALAFVTEHVIERTGIKENSQVVRLDDVITHIGTLFRNLARLFPFDYGFEGKVLSLILILCYCYLIFVYKKTKIDREKVLLMLLIGMIPYIRFEIMMNHSFLHCFFTYRAQMGTVVAMVLILYECTGICKSR